VLPPASRFGAVRSAAAIGLALGLAFGLGTCGGGPGAGSSSSSGQKPTKAVTSGNRTPLPAGKNPSPISVMVCSRRTRGEIAYALGMTATVPAPTWRDHLYSCHFDYPDGMLTLSVKELSSWSETYAWFASLKVRLGDRGALGNLGQGAFTTRDGGIVVRKDWKVLYVDISGLPPRFGKPATTRGEVAVTIADLILGCWAGD
jgi:hypothetical protein